MCSPDSRAVFDFGQEQKDDYEGKLLLVKGKLKRTEAVSERRLNWISSLQKDLDQEKCELPAKVGAVATDTM